MCARLSQIPRRLLHLFEEGDALVPGITAAHTATWHTPGATVFKVAPRGAERALVYTGDAFPAAGMGLEAPWIRSGFDERAEAGPAGKYALLDTFVEAGVWFHGYHAPFPAVVGLAADGTSFRGVRPPWEFQSGASIVCDAGSIAAGGRR